MFILATGVAAAIGFSIYNNIKASEEIKKLNADRLENQKLKADYKKAAEELKEALDTLDGILEVTENIEMNIQDTDQKPSYANDHAAGLDIRAAEKVIINPGEAEEVKTNFKIEIPNGYFGLVAGRSGLSFKHGINLYNGVGIIDNDYRGNVGVKLRNDSKVPYTIDKDERIAQIIIVPYIQPAIQFVKELSETSRGANGFGSTGKI